MIGVVDYGLGNVNAILNIYNDLGIPVVRFDQPCLASSLTHIVLPGVGAFDWAIHKLETSGLRPVLDKLVIDGKLPVLGICVGMQIMANYSSEGTQPGLGWIPGEVKLLEQPPFPTKIQLPHMGWNDVISINHPLFENISDPRFYFLHSYFFVPRSSNHILASVEYGRQFTAAVCNGNVLGVQFHPEKSHHWGISLLKNFAAFQYSP